MQKGLVWLLKHRLRSEAQGSGEKKSLKKCLMSQWLCYAKIHRRFKKKEWRLHWISKM